VKLGHYPWFIRVVNSGRVSRSFMTGERRGSDLLREIPPQKHREKHRGMHGEIEGIWGKLGERVKVHDPQCS